MIRVHVELVTALHTRLSKAQTQVPLIYMPVCMYIL